MVFTDVEMARVGDGCCVKNEEKCWEEFVGIRYNVPGLNFSLDFGEF